MTLSVKICIVGAGPAGLAAGALHNRDSAGDTVIVESNTVAGRKLLMTGGKRCNVTHQANAKELVKAFGPGGRFLRYSFHEFTPQRMIGFLKEQGVSVVTQADGCVFPETNRASTVRDALVDRALKQGVRFKYDRQVTGIRSDKQGFDVSLSCGGRLRAQRVVIATGGLSYAQTGSTGDGYDFARALGHTLIPTRPSLVGLVTAQTWPGTLSGTSLPTVTLATSIRNKRFVTSGHLVFTQQGLGGSAVQDMSRFLTPYLPNKTSPIPIRVDVLPDTPRDQLGKEIIDRCTVHPKKSVVALLSDIMPRRLAETLGRQSSVPEALEAGQLGKLQRKRLVNVIKSLELGITDAQPMATATVTQGGVNVAEINPQRMESTLCPGLFFAGEVLDVDGPCGGYHLQMCWSTGFVAGRAAAE
jgi:predicted Rossmann fold flavoprotein